MPFIGKWKVISEASGGTLEVMQENHICLSGDMLAEYGLKPNPLISGPEELTSIFNVEWSKDKNIFKTGLYHSPPESLGVGRYAEQNIGGYCYLKIHKNSAILVFSSSELKTNRFHLPTFRDTKAQRRVLSLYRIDTDPTSRGQHIKNMKNTLNKWLGSTVELNDSQKQMVGGFIDEEHSTSSADDK